MKVIQGTSMPQLTKFQAAAQGNMWSLRQHLADNPGAVRIMDPERNFMLHHAAKNGHLDAVRLLLSHGASVNSRGKDEITPLMLAAVDGNVAMCELLLDAGADPELKECAEYTTLHVAANRGHAEVCRLLVQRGAELHVLDRRGNTAMHIAAGKGHEAAVRVLLDLGADLALRNDNQSTVLAVGIGSGNLELCRFLLERGADPSYLTTKFNLNMNALHLAAGYDQHDICKLLVAHGMSSSFVPENATANYLTPFQYAVERGRNSVVAYFLSECGERLDQRSVAGKTLEEVAEQETEMMELLRAFKTEHAIGNVLDSQEIESTSKKPLGLHPL